MLKYPNERLHSLTFDWHEQERGLATEMTIEGQKHEYLADVSFKIESFSLVRKLKDFYWHYLKIFLPRSAKIWVGEDWPKSFEKIQWSAEIDGGGEKEVSNLKLTETNSRW